jgi:hypothetical protein
MFSDMWEFTLPFPTHHQVTTICQNIRNNRTWAYVALVVDPNDIYNNNYRLVGIIKFNEMYPLNWVRGYISSIANWQILIKDPNIWIRDFKNNMKHNINIENYWEEINDGVYIDY